MLHTKFRGNRSNCSGEEDFQGFLPYMGMVAILGQVSSIMPLNFNFLVPKSLLT